MTTTFFLAMFLATFILLTITRLEVSRLIRQYHQQKVDFFRLHPIQPGDIVMLGDSLTDGARWDEIFPGVPVKNRGINADTVAGVLARLDEIIAGKPAKIFLLIGTNDLSWYDYRGDHVILETYRQILARFKAELPGTDVYVQSLLPRGAAYAGHIRNINTALKVLSYEMNYAFVNLHPFFTDGKGALRKELTNDHLHLLGEGYRIWAEEIRKIVMGG